jgi:hypothetical protein
MFLFPSTSFSSYSFRSIDENEVNHPKKQKWPELSYESLPRQEPPPKENIEAHYHHVPFPCHGSPHRHSIQSTRYVAMAVVTADVVRPEKQTTESSCFRKYIKTNSGTPVLMRTFPCKYRWLPRWLRPT